MYKTAADSAHRNVMAGNILFKQIKVYGLLVDYKVSRVQRSFTLEIDFIKRESRMRWSKEPLQIEDAFQRLCHVCKQSLVPLK